MAKEEPTDFTIMEMVLLARKKFRIGGKSVSQHDFAHLIGVTPQHLNAIEGGKHTCSIKLLKKVAEVTGKKLVIKFE